MDFLGAGGSAIMPKLVKFVGLPSTLPGRRDNPIFHSICCRGALRVLTSLCVRFYVCLRGETSCSRSAKR